MNFSFFAEQKRKRAWGENHAGGLTFSFPWWPHARLLSTKIKN
jgi:hypothetical protein